MGTLRLTPEVSYGEAANVLNGYHRRFGRGPTNMWMSDPAAGFPQDLALSWDGERTFHRVCLTFDNLEPRREDTPWEAGRRVSDKLIKDYDLDVRVNGRWRPIASVRDNHHRRQVHTFESTTASQLRLRVLATHGPGWGARVYEVRVY
jgi:hypothetical protein